MVTLKVGTITVIVPPLSRRERAQLRAAAGGGGPLVTLVLPDRRVVPAGQVEEATRRPQAEEPPDENR